MIRKSLLLPYRIARRLQRDVAGLRRRLMMKRLMKKLKGVIHVGANTGHERDEYASYGLNVIWIEPIPWVFKQLNSAISSYPNQRALEYLVLDKDGERMTLHV